MPRYVYEVEFRPNTISSKHEIEAGSVVDAMKVVIDSIDQEHQYVSDNQIMYGMFYLTKIELKDK